MPLTDEERKAIVIYRLEKAEDVFVEAEDCASMGLGHLQLIVYIMLLIMLLQPFWLVPD